MKIGEIVTVSLFIKFTILLVASIITEENDNMIFVFLILSNIWFYRTLNYMDKYFEKRK